MTRPRRFALSAILVVVTTVVARADDVDEYLKGQLDSQHIPGMAVVVLKDGVVVKASAYGLANVEHRIPARPDTVFQIGSVSKQFIATGIMLLVQDGRLTVGDKVGRYLPGAPGTWQPITIRHLLSHTSGLTREAPGFDPYRVQPDLDVIKTAYALPLVFAPGERYEYSNLGYFVLGEIIRTVSGKPWAEFMTERVFAPLGMTSTRTTTMADVVPYRASGYTRSGNAVANAPNWPAVRPSGAFLSTVLDLAKWEAALLTDRVLTASSKAEMWTWVALNDGARFPYGFGWQLNDWPADSTTRTGVPMIRHAGSMPGFRAGFMRWPSHGLAVIVLTNLATTNIEALGANIAIRALPALKTAPTPQTARTSR